MRELLQQALDALESVYSRKPLRDLDETICALRSALAAPMPEPVAFVDGDEAHRKIIWSKCVASFDYEIGAPLYAAPPAAPAPGGMVMVPREPTPEMIEAADQSDKEYSLRAFGPGTVLAQSGYDHWVAMIAATPPAAPMPEPVAIGYMRPDELHKARRAPYMCRVHPFADRHSDMVPVYLAPPAAPADDLRETAQSIESGEIHSAHFSNRNLVMCSKEHYGAQSDAFYGMSAAPVVREPIIDEMDAVASRYAHKLALDLECVLSDYNGKWWDTAMQTIGEYRMAMNRIHERESPTHMGEPVLPKISSGVGK